MRRFSWMLVALLGACGGTQVEEQQRQQPAVAVEAPAVDVPRAQACARARPGVGAMPIGMTREGGAVALARAGAATIAYVADEDAQALHSVDVSSRQRLSTTPLAGRPGEVLVLADGRVAVTLRDKNRLQLFEPRRAAGEPLEALCAVKTPVEPVALAATPDEQLLVVTSAFGHKLSAFDTDALEHRFSVPLGRDPRDVLVAADGARAFVSHLVGGAVSVVDLQGDEHAVRRIGLERKSGSDAGDSVSNQGFALARALDPGQSERIFVPRVIIQDFDRFTPTPAYGGGIDQSPVVSVIDSPSELGLTPHTVSTARFAHACVLPRAAAVSGPRLLVTCLGSNALVELDARATDPVQLERRRWDVAGGPLGVAVDDDAQLAVVWSQFDRQLSVVDLASGELALVGAPLSAGLPETLALGRRLFHATGDPRMSNTGRACASCHPDGRDDGVTWSTPVGPRQTMMLAGRLEGSAPYSWLGEHATVDMHLYETFRRTGGIGIGDDLSALVAYVSWMPAPQLADALGEDVLDGDLAAHGKALFGARGCSGCHLGAGGTDATRHDLRTRTRGDSQGNFDTPSLRFVATTAPYFHDGRFASLVDLLTTRDPQSVHPHKLARGDAEALAAFLETL